MSYNYMICRKPIPSNIDEAWNYIEELSDSSYYDKRVIPEDFKKLYNILTEKYPCICDLPDDKIDEGVWSDGPLINNFTYDYICLGLVYSKVKKVLPFIISSVKKLGFVLFDPGNRKIYKSLF